MTVPVRMIDAADLKSSLHDGGEIALLDAREEVPFDARHLLMAACVPLSRLELLVDACVPRRSTRVVWCDDGEGLAAMPYGPRLARCRCRSRALTSRWRAPSSSGRRPW